MRVVYLHQYFSTPEMPGGSRSYQMARRLVAMGHEVVIITSDQHTTKDSPAWRESEEAGIQVFWTPISYDNRMSFRRRIVAFFAFAWRAAKKAAECDADIIFATSTPLTIALPAVYAARRSNCPMVFEVRDLWPAVPIAIGAIRNPLTKSAARWLERFAYRNSSKVVALAPGMKDAIVATGYPEERVAVIPNGCDMDVFSTGVSSQAVRTDNDWIRDRPLVRIRWHVRNREWNGVSGTSGLRDGRNQSEGAVCCDRCREDAGEDQIACGRVRSVGRISFLSGAKTQSSSGRLDRRRGHDYCLIYRPEDRMERCRAE